VTSLVTGSARFTRLSAGHEPAAELSAQRLVHARRERGGRPPPDAPRAPSTRRSCCTAPTAGTSSRWRTGA
jgi:hypothetical protein